MTNPTNLKLWARTLTEDEYDDAAQAVVRQELNEPHADVYDAEEFRKLFHHVTLPTPVLDVGCGSGKLGATYQLDPSPERASKSPTIKQGWMENMGLADGELGTIICWGTFCFLRSPIEALMEANRSLAMGGYMLFDVNIRSNMALVQTVDGPSFRNHLTLHGFEVVTFLEFGPEYHRRLGILMRKVRDWSPDWFRFPQAGANINNFLLERDWYMR